MSNPAPTPVPETPPPRRIRKRLYLPVILILLMIVVGVGFYVRGVWADTTERNPATADVGTITQLFRQPDGTVVVRCAIVIDAPPSATWGVVSGYDKHNEFMPYISKVEATKKDGGVVIVEGTAHSRIWGDWPFRSETTHRETPAAGEYSASWSEENKDVFKINRGSWKIVPNGSNKNQTLLVFTLQIELKDYPDAIVRNVIMDRLHTILKAVRDETLRRKKA